MSRTRLENGTTFSSRSSDAREHLKDGFVSTYADIVYRGDIVRGLVASTHDKVLGCDTDWRSRYVDRTHHPETDAEKLRAQGDMVTRLSRTIVSEQAAGEFIGVDQVHADGAAEFWQRSTAPKSGLPARCFAKGGPSRGRT